MQRRVIRPEGEVHLTTKEAAILQRLVDAGGEPVSRDQLLQDVWDKTSASSRTVDVAVSGLRKKIEADPKRPKLVLTEHGEGYRFAQPTSKNARIPTSILPPLHLPDGLIDLDAGVVQRMGHNTHLTHLEVALLQRLQGQTFVPRTDLLQAVWGSTKEGGALTQVLHRLRHKIEVDPKKPQVLLSKRGVGVRLQVVSRQYIRGFAHQTEDFVGRTDERSILTVALANNRLVTLHGPGGIGKTQLALSVADQQVGAFPGGVLHVAFVGASTEGDIVERLATALDAHDHNMWLEIIAQRNKSLLVLDNLEEGTRAAAKVIHKILEHTQASMLVTSRVLLHLTSERVVPLTSLSAPETTELLRRRATRMGFALEATPAELSVLAQKLQGHPLATEIAAAQLGSVSVTELGKRLEEPLDLTATTHQLRHQSLRRCLAHSWDLLAPEARSALGTLAGFQGGFTTHAAEALTQGQPVLQTLLGAALIQRTGSRFRILEPIRLFALEHHEPPEQEHALYFASLLPNDFLEEEARFEDPTFVLNLHQEAVNLAQAQATLTRLGRWDDAARVLILRANLAREWGGNANLVEQGHQISTGMSDDPLRARLHLILADLARFLDPDGLAMADSLLADIKEAPPPLELRKRHIRSLMYLRRGHLGQAREEMGLLHHQATAQGDPIQSLAQLQVAKLREAGDPKAAELARQALAQHAGGALARAELLGAMAHVLWTQEHTMQARWALEEALEILGPFRSRWARHASLAGGFALYLGDLGAAMEILRKGLSILEEIAPGHRNIGIMSWQLATAEWLHTGRLTRAIQQRYNRCLLDPHWGTQDLACFHLGLAFALEDKPNEATQFLKQGQRTLPADQPAREARYHAALAWVQDDPKEAERAAGLVFTLPDTPTSAALLALALQRQNHPRAEAAAQKALDAANRMAMLPTALTRVLLDRYQLNNGQ